jgi:hypothetical protein
MTNNVSGRVTNAKLEKASALHSRLRGPRPKPFCHHAKEEVLFLLLRADLHHALRNLFLSSCDAVAFTMPSAPISTYTPSRVISFLASSILRSGLWQ